jgi:putative membrane protein insertion efficiency factor
MTSRPVLIAFLVFLAVDAFLPPRLQPTAWILRGAIRAYQVTLSPLLAAGRLASCRFEPTCSRYGAEAIARYGTWKGGAKTVWRVFRCNPWGGSGYDPP